MKIKNFKTAKDIFQKTYNKKMFDFMGFGEISLMKKVVQVKQTQQKERKKHNE
jgi:ABC-type sugar transport system ATPase subunit